MIETLSRILHLFLNTNTNSNPISFTTTTTKYTITNTMTRYDVKECIPTISVLLLTGVILVTVVPYVFKVSFEGWSNENMPMQCQCQYNIRVTFPRFQSQGCKTPCCQGGKLGVL